MDERPTIVPFVRDEIARIRAQEGMTQADLARACGWTQSRISRIESGSAPIKLRDLERIAATLGVELVRMLERPSRRLRERIKLQELADAGQIDLALATRGLCDDLR